MIKGVIFDIDGIIVDSEPLHMEALFEAIRRELNEKIDVNRDNLIGLTLEETINKFGIPSSKRDSIKEFTIKYYLNHVNAALIRKDIEKLWTALIENNIKFGCVSTAELKICRANVKLLGLEGKRNIPIIGLESVERSKPDPLPYTTMLNTLNLNGDEVIVLEDSDVGISSAVSAGITNVYAWPHNLSASQKYNKAKKVIADLHEIDFFNKMIS